MEHGFRGQKSTVLKKKVVFLQFFLLKLFCFSIYIYVVRTLEENHRKMNINVIIKKKDGKYQ